MKNKLIPIISTLFILIIVIYRETFLWLIERYRGADSYYSHGFLVPFIAAYLIWLKRGDFKDLKWDYNLWGMALIIFGLTIHFLSMFFEVFFISAFSILFLVFGVSLWLFGIKITKKVAFPLCFLIFMFPLPLVAINSISFPMKMLVTKSAVFLLKTSLNIPIKNEGFQVFFPNATLIIENPCSGLRSLISMLALGSIFAFLLKANLNKRILLFLLSVPIALLSNLTRVIMLCLAVYIYGNQIMKSFFHDFSGYLVFFIAFAALWYLWRSFQCKNFG